MGARAWTTFVLMVLAGNAQAQPSATPPGPPPQPQPPPQPLPPQPLPPPPQHMAPAKEPEPHALCFAGRPYECASVLLLELGARGGRRGVLTGDVGLVVHDGLNAYGATLGILGYDDDDPDVSDEEENPHVWYAARYRRYLGTWGMAADVSVGYAGGPALEVAIGWSDVIALTAGLNGYDRPDGSFGMVPTAGVRVGSVAIGGVIYVTVLVATSAR